MIVTRLDLRGFRSHDRAEIPVGAGLTVVTGPNGIGKTNLLEALYAGCTGRGCRAGHDRELIALGGDAARVEVAVEAPDGHHTLAVGLQRASGGRSAEKRITVDGHAVDALADSSHRPLLSVFLPDRLELVTGPPTLRRAHLDQVVVARRPAAAATRRAYAAALAQRNALLGRIRSGAAGWASLDVWDRELARHGVAVMELRADVARELATPFADHARGLGLDGDVTLAYRPRSAASVAEELAAELAERRQGDVERGFTGYGPHRDDLALRRDGRELRAYGSRGQQRIALLALLLAERDELAAARGTPPMMLLDDVMSELDAERRGRLVEVLAAAGGQAMITATEREHVPVTAAMPVQWIDIDSAGVHAPAVLRAA